MARRTITLDEKIKKAEAVVASTKAKYDAALDQLEKLVTKRKQLDDKKVLEAYHAGDKTADEIVAFIQSTHKQEEQNHVIHVFCKHFLQKSANHFCRLVQLHFVGKCNGFCRPDVSRQLTITDI